MNTYTHTSAYEHTAPRQCDHQKAFNAEIRASFYNYSIQRKMNGAHRTRSFHMNDFGHNEKM